MPYEIYDDFIAKTDAAEIESLMLSPEFPWFFNDFKVDKTRAKNSLQDYQFTHRFFRDYTWQSQWAGAISPIIEAIQPKALIRIKANLNPVTTKPYEGGWHNDFEFECKTAVYYVNTNNGGTKFKNGDFIKSEANRLVVFDSFEEHTSVSSTDSKARCLINLNYFV